MPLTLNRTLKILTSYRLAFMMVGAMFVGTSVAAIIRPSSKSAEASPLWMVALLILAGVLVLCSFNRSVREIERRRNRVLTFRHYGRRFHFFTTIPMEVVWQVIHRHLLTKRWSVRCHTRRRFATVEKGNAGIWGSIVFHLALVFVISGILVNANWGFRGMFALTQGERFVEGKAAFKNASSGRFNDSSGIRGTEIFLEKFEKAYSRGGTVTPASYVTVKLNGGTLKGIVHVNHGLRNGGYVLHQGKWGYSPQLVILDSTGKTILAGFVRIATQVKGDRVSFADSLFLPDDMKVYMEFFPNFRERDELVRPEGQDLKNPVVYVTLFQHDEVLLENFLWLGSHASVNSYFVAFPQIRYWSQFELVHEPGTAVMYLGFLLSIGGLTVRLVSRRKRISVSVSREEFGTTVLLSGWSENFRNSFAVALENQFEELLHHIQAEKARLPEPVRLPENQGELEPCN